MLQGLTVLVKKPAQYTNGKGKFTLYLCFEYALIFYESKKEISSVKVAARIYLTDTFGPPGGTCSLLPPVKT